MFIIYAGPDIGLLVIGAVFMLLILIAIFEMIGLNVRINITVFASCAVALLLFSFLAAFMPTGLRYTLFTSGAVLAIIILLYGLFTARRMETWRWFMVLLAGGVVSLLGLIVLLNRLTPPFTGLAAIAIISLCCLPAACVLLYAARSPKLSLPPALNPRSTPRRGARYASRYPTRRGR